MATILAIATGNWSSASTWTGGVIPGAGDVAVANTYNITIDTNVSAIEIRNDTFGGATSGGRFFLNSGVTLTANVTGSSFSAILLTLSAGSATINGNITGTPLTNALTVQNTGTGTLTVNGTLTGATTGTTNSCISNTGGGNVIVNGAVNGGVLGSAYGIISTGGNVTVNGALTAAGTANSYACNISGGNLTVTQGPITSVGVGGALNFASNGTCNITANLIGGSGSLGIAVTFNSTTGSMTVTGNVTGNTGSANAPGISVTGAGTLTVNGNLYGLAAPGVTCGTGTVIINGTVYGGTGSGVAGLNNASTGTATINGTAVGGINGPGASNAASGQLTVTRAKGNAFGAGASGVTSQVGVANVSTGVCIVKELEFGSAGQSPTSGAITFANVTDNKAIVFRSGGTFKSLVDANTVTSLLPAASDVRSGVSYNQGNNTGTCVIPAASSVTAGVAVDTTVGTAVLTAAAIWDELTSNARTSGSYGERLKQASTTATTAQQLADMT